MIKIKTYGFLCIVAFLTILLTSQTLFADASESIKIHSEDKVLTIDSLDAVSLLGFSEYYFDDGKNYSFNSPPEKKDWLSLDRSQLRFGYVESPLWLNINFKTDGVKTREAVIDFDKIIDNVDAQIFVDGEEVVRNKLGTDSGGFLRRLYLDRNQIELSLVPNSKYRILVKINSVNAIQGDVVLRHSGLHSSEKQEEFVWYLVYAVVLSIILLYNLAAYFSTQYKAYLYHVIYGVCILVFQLSQYGYLNSLLGVEDSRVRELLILFSMSIAYLAVLHFIDVVLECHKYEPIFSKINQALRFVASLVMVVSIFIPHLYGMMGLLVVMGAGVIAGIAYIVWAIPRRNARAWYLLAILLCLVPSVSMLALARLGFIDKSFWSENLVLISSSVEMLIISVMLFVQIKSIKKDVSRAKYFNPDTLLPNKYSLRDVLERRPENNPENTLVYIWLSGLTKIEVLLGVEKFKEYIAKLSNLVNPKICALSFVQTNEDRFLDGYGVFVSGRDTYATLIKGSDERHLNKIKQIFDESVLQLQQEYHFYQFVKPVLAGCSYQGNNLSADVIMQRSELALSSCIKNNENQLIYDETLGELEHRQAMLTCGFEDSIREHHFFLLWQPQFDSTTSKLVGLEALARWNHPDYGLISPVEFIPLLEDTQQIKSLTHWVIRSVFKGVEDIRKHFPEIDLSINLSVCDFLDDDLLQKIDGYLESDPMLSTNITLEVTESVMIEDEARILDMVKALQMRGFKVSIDDFGAGYASFGYLQNIPANELKIDRRYTMSCEEESSQAIIKSIIHLAKQLNIKTVVEGIEQQFQEDLFREWGIGRFQGWKFAKPMLLEDVVESYARQA